MPITDLVATERLRLYRPTADDLAPIHALFADEWSLEQTRASLDEWLAHWDSHGFGYWVARNDAGEFVGVGGIAKKRLADGELENLFYKIAPRARDRGYATEIARAALDAAFTKLHFERVHAIIEPRNSESIAVARRVGMMPAGELDHDGRLLFVAERSVGD